MGVSVSCTTNTYAIGGTMTGITGGTLVLRSGSETISLTAATSFGFLTRIASGAPYAVTVATHPTGQYCQVQNGSGTITTSDITNVTVTCGLVPYATAQLAGGTRRVAFLYVPAGTSIASNAEYKTYCESRGLSQNQNASNGPPFTSAGMSNATAYYCSGYCCYLGVGNSRASGLSAWQNFGLPLATALQVFDRGCGDFNTSYNTGVVTVDSLTIDANGAGSHVANA